MAQSFDPVAHNRAAWDREVDRDNEWTRPVGPDVIARARAGDWSVVLIGHQPVPRDWFPADLADAAVLGLASGGGQQGPVLAAAGGEAEYGDPGQVGGEPVAAHRLVPDEHHRPVAGPGPGDDIGANRLGPLVALVHLAIPGGAVVRDGI